MRWFDALEAYEAWESVGGGEGEEGLDFGEVQRGGRWLVGELEVGFENGVGEVGMEEGGGYGVAVV